MPVAELVQFNEDLLFSLRQPVAELNGNILGCWCSPEACQGDILSEFANR